MPGSIRLHTDTALAQGLRELFQLLEGQLQLRQPVNVFLAGGMAVYLYTASRVTTDVDAQFAARIVLPPGMAVPIVLEDGTEQIVFLDTNYNPTSGMVRTGYVDRAIPVDLGLEMLQVLVLAPVDLAVSKLSRFAQNDRDDIEALVKAGLVGAAELQAVADEAVSYYVGGLNMLKFNIRDAVALARAVELELAHSGNTIPAATPAERACRLAELPALRRLGGTARSFGELAEAALAAADNVAAVDWKSVERATMSARIEQCGEDANAVADVLCRYSPDALSWTARVRIRTWAQMFANPVASTRAAQLEANQLSAGKNGPRTR